MGAPLLVALVGGTSAPWRVERMKTVIGEALPSVQHLSVVEGAGAPVPEGAWVLRGVTSNERYVTAEEHAALAASQEGLGRPEATRAALIPVRKSAAWWDLSQDQRRAMFEERSRHVGLGLEFLPAVARRLHHGRDLGEPFDFLTWFEYAPEHTHSFEQLVNRLRTSEEWQHVEREIDIRLTQA
jgi:chlorite dismutase